MYILILCQHYRGKLQLVQEHGGLTSFAYSSERVKKLHDILEVKESDNILQTNTSLPKAMEGPNRHGLQIKAIF